MIWPPFEGEGVTLPADLSVSTAALVYCGVAHAKSTPFFEARPRATPLPRFLRSISYVPTLARQPNDNHLRSDHARRMVFLCDGVDHGAGLELCLRLFESGLRVKQEGCSSSNLTKNR